MKKLLTILLTAVLSCSLLLTVACTPKDENQISVGILQVATHTALDNARQGFKDELNKWASENGKTIKYNEQNAGGDSNNETTLAESIVTKNPDLVLGIATSSARALANATGSIPVLFTAVTAPEEENLITNNVTGTSDMNPVADQIALIQELVEGKLTKIGFLYNGSENNSVIQYELARAKCVELGVEIVKMNASLSSEIQTVVEGVQAGVQAVYVPTDNLMASNMTLICDILHSKNIPVVAGEAGMCEDGEAVATLAVDYYGLGVQTAKMAIAILSGEKTPNQIEFEYYNQDPQFYINEQNALTAGIREQKIAEIISNHTN